MDDASKGLRVRNFFEIEAKALLDRFRVIETLLPHRRARGAAHRGEEGRFIESLLRTFLNKHLPGNLRAVSGFILSPATKTGVSNLKRVEGFDDRHSGQLDVIIYDFDGYPTFEKFEEFCIVPPEGVVGIISVKKTLYNRDIGAELTALKEARAICADGKRRGPFTALFAFGAGEKSNDRLDSKIFEAVRAEHANDAFDLMINEISVLGRTCVFKVRSEHSPPGKARYVGVNCRIEQHIPLQRLLQSLLSVYHDETRGALQPRPGFVSFAKGTFKKSPNLGLVDYCEADKRAE